MTKLLISFISHNSLWGMCDLINIFFGVGAWTQVLVRARQMLYYCAAPSAPCSLKIFVSFFRAFVLCVCVCVCGTGVLTQSFTLARQALYNLSHSISLIKNYKDTTQYYQLQPPWHKVLVHNFEFCTTKTLDSLVNTSSTPSLSAPGSHHSTPCFSIQFFMSFDSQRSEIMQYLLICVWFISLSIKSSWFFQVTHKEDFLF
jgi:hypothetical protein